VTRAARTPHLEALLALICAAGLPGLALLGRALFGGEELTGGILQTFFVPHYALLGERLAAAELPLWNPLLGNGSSWLGPRAGGVLYPPNLLFAAFDVGRALPLFVHGHLMLAGAGAWTLTERLDRGSPRSGRAAACFAYALGGFVVSMIGNPVYLVSAAWLPWAAAGGLHAGEAGAAGRRAVALVGAAVGACFLAGEPQGALLAAVAAGGFAWVRKGGGGPASLSVRLSAGVVLGCAAGGLFLVSTFALLPETDRALAGWGDAEFGRAWLPTLLDLLIPGVVGFAADEHGGFWGGALGARNLWCALWVGTLGLAAALAGAARGTTTSKAGGALLASAAVLVAVDPGQWLGLRFAPKWWVAGALGLSLWVGEGLPAVLRANDPVAGWARRGLWTACGLGLLASVASLVGGPALEGGLASGDPARVVGPAARSAIGLAGARAALVALAALGLAWAVGNGRLRRRLAQSLLLGLLLLDLLSASTPLVRTTPFPLTQEPALARSLRAEAGAGPLPRFDPRGPRLPADYVLTQAVAKGADRLQVSELFYRDVLWRNVGALHGVRTVRAFETVEPRARALLEGGQALGPSAWEALFDGELLLFGRGELAALPAEEREHLRVLLPAGAHTPQVVLVRNLRCPPWASVPATTPADDLEAALVAVAEAGGPVPIGPEGLGEPGSAPCGPVAPHQLEVLAYEPERIRVRVVADAPGWLVLREAYDPDWSATVDGRPAPLGRAGLLFRAVPVAGGAQEVELVYAPSWLARALGLTALGWLAILVLLACPSQIGARQQARNGELGEGEARATP
jgi:hypothetical protein